MRRYLALPLAAAIVIASVSSMLTCPSGPQPAAASRDPLPSWRDGPARRAIIELVDRVTTPGSPEFVPSDERIAVLDNDGTLWIYPFEQQRARP